MISDIENPVDSLCHRIVRLEDLFPFPAIKRTRAQNLYATQKRRTFLQNTLSTGAGLALGTAFSSLAILPGCTGTGSVGPSNLPDLIFGQRGLADGRFQKPRAIAIDQQDRIYVSDKTGRIQVFDDRGKFIRGWCTPEIEAGKPTGLSIDRDGTLMVADTHYYRFLFYTPNGDLLDQRTIGGTNGPDPGQFAFVTDIIRAPSGEFFCGEYGEFDRLHRYSADGKYIDRMGEHGNGELQFSRPQSFALDNEGLLWIADACNHRIQVIDWRSTTPQWVKTIGTQGNELGQLQYPYGLALGKDGSILVSEFGNHRVQKLDLTGKPIASWGTPGSEPGQLNQPWATATDSRNRVYVVDSGNNRIQRFRI